MPTSAVTVGVAHISWRASTQHTTSSRHNFLQMPTHLRSKYSCPMLCCVSNGVYLSLIFLEAWKGGILRLWHARIQRQWHAHFPLLANVGNTRARAMVKLAHSTVKSNCLSRIREFMCTY